MGMLDKVIAAMVEARAAKPGWPLAVFFGAVFCGWGAQIVGAERGRASLGSTSSGADERAGEEVRV